MRTAPRKQSIRRLRKASLALLMFVSTTLIVLPAFADEPNLASVAIAATLPVAAATLPSIQMPPTIQPNGVSIKAVASPIPPPPVTNTSGTMVADNQAQPPTLPQISIPAAPGPVSAVTVQTT